MPIDRELIDLLVCPDTRAPLRLAEPAEVEALNQRIAQNAAQNKKGDRVKTPVEGGLIRADGKILYPIRDDIPDLLIEEGIVLES